MSARALATHGKSNIASALAQSAVAVRETGPNAWLAVLSTGTRLKARADAGAGWLVLEASTAGRAAERRPSLDAWAWLESNARIEGTIKIGLPLNATSPLLRVDIPLGEETIVFARVTESCAALARATRAIAEGIQKVDGLGATAESRARAEARAYTADSSGTTFGAGERTPAAGSDVVLDLAALCAEAGWAFAELDRSRLSIGLGVERRPAHAVLEPTLHGGARARVEVVRRDKLTRTSRYGLGVFLLTTSASVRLARAYVDEGANYVAAGFEVQYASPPTAGELGHALSSLSVAWALFGLEAQALAEDRVARAYLAVRGAARDAAPLGDTAGEREDRSQALVRRAGV